MESLSCPCNKHGPVTLRQVAENSRLASPGRTSLKDLLASHKAKKFSSPRSSSPLKISEPLKSSEPVVISLSSPTLSSPKRGRGRPRKLASPTPAPTPTPTPLCGCGGNEEMKSPAIEKPKISRTKNIKRFASPPAKYSTPVKIVNIQKFTSPQPQRTVTTFASPSGVRQPTKLGKNLATIRYLASINAE